MSFETIFRSLHVIKGHFLWNDLFSYDEANNKKRISVRFYFVFHNRERLFLMEHPRAQSQGSWLIVNIPSKGVQVFDEQASIQIRDSYLSTKLNPSDAKAVVR